MFTETKSGKLDIPQEELKNHLRMAYSDAWKDVPIPPMNDLSMPQLQVMFNDNILKLREVWEFDCKYRGGSATEINVISYKLYKNCPNILKQLNIFLQRAWKQSIVQEWCLVNNIWIPREKNAKGIANLRPILLLNVERKIFWGVYACRLTDFLLGGNHCINITVQEAGISGFASHLEHSHMI